MQSNTPVTIAACFMVTGVSAPAGELSRFVSVNQLMLQDNGSTSLPKDLTTKCTPTGADHMFSPSLDGAALTNIAHRIMVFQVPETFRTVIFILKVESRQYCSNHTMTLSKELSRSSNTLTAKEDKVAPSLLTQIQTTLKPTLTTTCGKVICTTHGPKL